MKTLEFVPRLHRRHQARKPGTREWCAMVKEVALDRALVSVENSKITPSDVKHLMKIRKGVIETLRKERKVTWIDPPGWGSDSGPVAA